MNATYSGNFKNLVYGELPNEEKIPVTFELYQFSDPTLK
jgi:hypothetical protein